MSKTIRITLRAGERVYVNGAVIRVDRKTSLEFLNNVVFLLEQHVMQEEDATTPLRQLYFTVQKLLIEPGSGFTARQEFYARYLELLDRYREDEETVMRLHRIRALVNVGRNFEALKRIRSLCEAEDAMLAARDGGDGAQARQQDARQQDVLQQQEDVRQEEDARQEASPRRRVRVRSRGRRAAAADDPAGTAKGAA